MLKEGMIYRFWHEFIPEAGSGTVFVYRFRHEFIPAASSGTVFFIFIPEVDSDTLFYIGSGTLFYIGSGTHFYTGR